MMDSFFDYTSNKAIKFKVVRTGGVIKFYYFNTGWVEVPFTSTNSDSIIDMNIQAVEGKSGYTYFDMTASRGLPVYTPGARVDITVEGSFSLTHTNFISTEGTLSVRDNFYNQESGYFDPQYGKVKIKNTGHNFHGGGIQLYNLEFVDGTNTTIDSSCFVTNNLYLSEGNLTQGTDGTILLYRDMTCSAHFGNMPAFNNALIDMTGTNSQNIRWDNGGFLPSLMVDKPNLSRVDLQGPGSPLRIQGDFLLEYGTLDLNGYGCD
jgi:hypothetical protein